MPSITPARVSSVDDYVTARTLLADRYTLDREIGRGGMATVYLAEETKHSRQVAIKVLRPELAATLGAERFLREIGIAARLSRIWFHSSTPGTRVGCSTMCRRTCRAAHCGSACSATARCRFATRCGLRTNWPPPSTTRIAPGSFTAM
jgi:hypothetical protein